MRGFRSPSTFRRTCAAVAALIAVAGIVGPASNVSATVAHRSAAAKRVYSARTTAAFPLPGAGMSIVQSVKLPVGAWSVIAKATAINPTSDYVRCQIYDNTNGVGLDGSTDQLSRPNTQGGVITNLATVVVSSGTLQIQQRCGHDSAANPDSYLDPDATIVAFATTDGTAAGQSVVRTSAATTVTQTESGLLQMYLSPGTYALGFKITAVSFSTESLVYCDLNGPHGRLGTTIADLGTETTTAMTNAAFTYVSTLLDGPIQVNVLCHYEHDAGAYIDPGAVLWARKVDTFTAVEGGCGITLVNGTTDLVATVRPYAPCNIPDEPVTLSNAYVAKGTWVAVGGEGNVANGFAQSDYLRCELSTDRTGRLDASAAWEVHDHSLGITVLGTVKLTLPSTFQETCSRDRDNALSGTLSGSMVLIRV